MLSFNGAAIPSMAAELPAPKLSADIIKIDAPAFAALAEACSAAGPSPITMMSHASKYSTSVSHAKSGHVISNALKLSSYGC